MQLQVVPWHREGLRLAAVRFRLVTAQSPGVQLLQAERTSAVARGPVKTQDRFDLTCPPGTLLPACYRLQYLAAATVTPTPFILSSSHLISSPEPRLIALSLPSAVRTVGYARHHTQRPERARAQPRTTNPLCCSHHC
jgi:hypothetical protein